MRALFPESGPSAGSQCRRTLRPPAGCSPRPAGGRADTGSPRRPRPGWPDRGRGWGASRGSEVGLPRSWIQTELLCNWLERIADDLHVRVEGYTERLRARDHLLSVHATCERLVLHLLAHRARLDRAKRPVRLDQRARDDEAAHLVDRVERFADVRIARDVQVVGVRCDVVKDVFRPAPVAQHLDAAHRVKFEVRARLVVPIVDQAQYGPTLLILT